MKFGHLFYECYENFLYTGNRLKHIHRHLYRAYPDEVYNLIKRAGERNSNKETYDQLESITSDCDIRQRLAKATERLRVAFPSEYNVQNWTILSEIMSPSSKPILHIIC